MKTAKFLAMTNQLPIGWRDATVAFGKAVDEFTRVNAHHGLIVTSVNITVEDEDGDSHMVDYTTEAEDQ